MPPANIESDPFFVQLTDALRAVIRDLAKFQLDGIRWRQEVDQELQQLRKQREKQPTGTVPPPEEQKRK